MTSGAEGNMGEHSAIHVVDNKAEHRFEAVVDGELAIAAYRRRGDTITFTHTEVPPALERRGVASALARAALERVRDEGLRVVPRCPFMAAYIARHPELQPLLQKTAAD